MSLIAIQGIFLHLKSLLEYVLGVVVAQWIRLWNLNHEVPGSNLLAAADVPLSKALYPHCLVPRKGLIAIGPLVGCSFVSSLLS